MAPVLNYPDQFFAKGGQQVYIIRIVQAAEQEANSWRSF